MQGRVVDADKLIIGANVIQKGANSNCITIDADERFSLNIT
jgi:hypothetical protein